MSLACPWFRISRLFLCSSTSSAARLVRRMQKYENRTTISSHEVDQKDVSLFWRLVASRNIPATLGAERASENIPWFWQLQCSSTILRIPKQDPPVVDPTCMRRKSGHLHLSNNPKHLPQPAYCSPLRVYLALSRRSRRLTTQVSLCHGMARTGWASANQLVRSRALD